MKIHDLLLEWVGEFWTKNKRIIMSFTRTFVFTFISIFIPAVIAMGIENLEWSALIPLAISALNAALRTGWKVSWGHFSEED